MMPWLWFETLYFYRKACVASTVGMVKVGEGLCLWQTKYGLGTTSQLKHLVMVSERTQFLIASLWYKMNSGLLGVLHAHPPTHHDLHNLIAYRAH